MTPYGHQHEHQLQDRKRRYLSRRMRACDLAAERADKRRARAAGKHDATCANDETTKPAPE